VPARNCAGGSDIARAVQSALELDADDGPMTVRDQAAATISRPPRGHQS